MPSPIAGATLAGVLERYPLDGARVVAALEASTRNDNFVVENVAGGRFVLRCYRRNPNAERVAFQIEFQRHLHKQGFPMADVIEGATGEPCVRAGDEIWALFTYVEGEEYDFSRMGQVAEAGRRLAEFHLAAESFPGEEVPLDINFLARRWWTDGEEMIAGLESMFAGRGADGELGFVREWRRGLMREWPLERFDALPAGWVHSDYHGRNMVFVGDALAGLFDFDPLTRDALVLDIASAIFMFGREHRLSLTIRLDAAQTFVQGYQGRRPLGEAEQASLPAMAVLARAVAAPAYYMMLERDGEDPVRHLRKDVVIMHAVQSEMERLGPLFVAG